MRRGLVLPSPVVLLSIVAVMMAGVAFVATRNAAPDEKEITTISDKPSASRRRPTPSRPRSRRPSRRWTARKVPVEVYNNSGVTGLAGKVATQASRIGWQVVGTDNWYGTVDATTVYYPKRLKAAAKQLALDLGIKRTAPAIDPMRLDRLTLILTGRSSSSRVTCASSPSRSSVTSAGCCGRSAAMWWASGVEFTSAEGEQRYAALVRAAADAVDRPRLRRHARAHRRRPGVRAHPRRGGRGPGRPGSSRCAPSR